MGAQPSREVLFQQSDTNIEVTEGVVRDLIRHHQLTNRKGPQPHEDFKDEADLRLAYTELHDKYKQATGALQAAHNKGFQRGAALERRDREQELMRLDMQWQNRVDEIQQHREENATQQFEGLLADFKSRFSMDVSEPQCQVQEGAVLACFKSNPSRPLDCAEEVNRFLACAERARAAYLGNVSR
ncbi:hypothetical protein PTSG_10255 [Salpingoeca rosetta]|uniref:Coiled-coil-helix-coiled-coil-helix domain-containing protein 3, mitochondrial n=1 Tax=Salpingoeca rosetta (strain ATCC 50818 / BSB-021) TaxID=946362 RepID=F2UQR9_SALR5|nr:uncharacterized protein PTSG_10255 [Salpingoeca rosetta]EGD79974.1 hypothetical protein PTSG_10255 [Salpingoeca rosetta]|eukprot:XP_004988595.1 hypothetical protein PTSG_10255 [Salpingoeca rosetta]